MARRTYLDGYYEATVALYTLGHRAISARAIANEFHAGAPKIVVTDVKKKLGAISKRCSASLGVRPVLVNGAFFQKAHGEPMVPTPTGKRLATPAEARYLLANGRAKGAQGLWFPNGMDDPLEIASREIRIASGSGKVEIVLDEAAAAFRGGRLSAAAAREITSQTPSVPHELSEVPKALPAGEWWGRDV